MLVRLIAALNENEPSLLNSKYILALRVMCNIFNWISPSRFFRRWLSGTVLFSQSHNSQKNLYIIFIRMRLYIWDTSNMDVPSSVLWCAFAGSCSGGKQRRGTRNYSRLWIVAKWIIYFILQPPSLESYSSRATGDIALFQRF